MSLTKFGSRVKLATDLPSLRELKVYISSHKNFGALEQRNVYLYFSTRSKHIFCPKRHLGKKMDGDDWTTINNMLMWCDILVVSGDTAGVVEKRSFKEIETALSLNKPVFRAAVDKNRTRNLRPRVFDRVESVEPVKIRRRNQDYFARLNFVDKNIDANVESNNE